MMKCERCGSDTRMQVQVVISAPGELAHRFSKQNLRRKDVYLMGVLWETADFICTNHECRNVSAGYGNYVTNLKREVERLRRDIADTEKNLIKALEAAEFTLRRIAEKNEKLAEATLNQIKESGGDVTKWPGGWFEDIAEAAQGRASICKAAIVTARAAMGCASNGTTEKEG